MKVDPKTLLVIGAGVGAATLLPRVIQAVLLRFTGTVVRDERVRDRAAPPW